MKVNKTKNLTLDFNANFLILVVMDTFCYVRSIKVQFINVLVRPQLQFEISKKVGSKAKKNKFFKSIVFLKKYIYIF